MYESIESSNDTDSNILPVELPLVLSSCESDINYSGTILISRKKQV